MCGDFKNSASSDDDDDDANIGKTSLIIRTPRRSLEYGVRLMKVLFRMRRNEH